MNNKNLKQSFLENKIEEINLDIIAWAKKKLILKKCQYTFKGHSINVLIGSSGSGKTTLLNYFSSITHLTDGIEFNCRVRINNLKLNNINELQQEIGFVPQFEVIDRKLTAFEYYKYLCKLLGIKNYKKKINKVLKILDLEHIKNTIIGDPMKKGISGGELKRVSIGIQLLRKPNILVLDEPTTGLDSESALNLLQHLKTLTDLGITIILSLHQPSNQIINLIHNVTILSEGVLVYQGSKLKMNEHFKKMKDFKYEFATFENILEYLDKDSLKIQLEKEEKINGNIENKIFKLYQKRIKLLNELTEKYLFENSISLNKYELKKRKKKISFIKEFVLTFNFLVKCYFKNKIDVIMKLVQLVFFVGILYATYNNLGDYKKDTQAAIQNRSGLMYFTIFGMSHVGLTSSSKVFIPRKNIFLNEKYSNFHRNWIYYMCIQFYELPYILFLDLIFSILYTMIFKFHNNENFFFFFMVIYFNNLLILITSYSIGIILNIFAKTLEQVSSLINIISLPLSMVVGFYCNINDMVIHMRLLSYISNFRYAFQNMILLGFEDRKTNKDCFILKEGKTIELDYEKNKFCYPFNYYNFKQDYKENFMFLVIFFIVLRVIGLLIFVMKFRNKNIKNSNVPISNW